MNLPQTSLILSAAGMMMAVIAVILCFTVEARRKRHVLRECKAIREDLEKLKADLLKLDAGHEGNSNK